MQHFHPSIHLLFYYEIIPFINSKCLLMAKYPTTVGVGQLLTASTGAAHEMDWHSRVD